MHVTLKGFIFMADFRLAKFLLPGKQVSSKRLNAT